MKAHATTDLLLGLLGMGTLMLVGYCAPIAGGFYRGVLGERQGSVVIVPMRPAPSSLLAHRVADRRDIPVRAGAAAISEAKKLRRDLMILKDAIEEEEAE